MPPAVLPLWLTVAANLLPSADIHAPDQNWLVVVMGVHVAPRFAEAWNKPLVTPATSRVQSLEAARQLKFAAGAAAMLNQLDPALVETEMTPPTNLAR